MMLIEPRRVPNNGNNGNIPAKGCMMEQINEFYETNFIWTKSMIKIDVMTKLYASIISKIYIY